MVRLIPTILWLLIAGLSLNLAASSYSYAGDLFCFETVSTKEYLDLKIEPVFNPLDSNSLTFNAYINGTERAGFLEARFQSTGVHIAHIRVNEAHRNQGISKALLKKLIDRTGTHATYSIYLIETNRDVFVKTFGSISLHESPLHQTKLNLRDKQLIAIKSTPAYKAQEAAGIGKIVKYEIANCTETECSNPIIYYHVTGN